MKGNYNIRKLILSCMLICGITATVETIVIFFGMGKISWASLVVTILFIIFLVLRAILETGENVDGDDGNPPVLLSTRQQENTSFPSHNTKKGSKDFVKEPPQTGQGMEEYHMSPQTGQRMENFGMSLQTSQMKDACKVLPQNQIYREKQASQEQQISQFSLSMDDLAKIYDYSWLISNDNRAKELKKYSNRQLKLELTERAKTEVNNLQKDTPLFKLTDDGNAAFFLYDNIWLFPSLDTYLSWYRKPYDSIKENLLDLMLNYIFNYEPQKIDGGMVIISLKPAKVEQDGCGEYLISDNGELSFGYLD